MPQHYKNDIFQRKYVVFLKKEINLKRLILSLLLFFSFTHSSTKKVDLVIYSYNRPIQLYALLESIDKFVTGTGEISIIYRADNRAFALGYEEVKEDFSHMTFFKQGPNPYADFKSFVMKSAFETPNNYVCFAVDDIIMKDYVNLTDCIYWLEQTGTYGFYLRLGKNITENYTGKKKTPVPPNTKIAKNIYMWKFSDGNRPSWDFPNTCDMTIYKKSDIKKDLESINNFQTTAYETEWAKIADHSKYGLCYKQSKIVNISINLVQEVKPMWRQFTQTWKGKMLCYSPKELLKKFNSGFKIDIRPFYKAYNRAPHIERELSFVKRKSGPNNYKKPEHELPFVFVVTSYNNKDWYKLNLDSIFMQDYKNYRVIYIDDCSTDKTANLVEQYVQKNGYRDRCILIKNDTRKFKLENFYDAVHQYCDDDEIVFVFDGDDWLAHANVLNRINQEYLSSDIWLTYGSYEDIYEEGRPSIKRCADMREFIEDSDTFLREASPRSHFIPGHPKTFYSWLFKKIRLEDFYYGENFAITATDNAMGYPIHEMAKDRYAYIEEVLYIRNCLSQLNNYKVCIQRQRETSNHFRSLPIRYSPLNSPEDDPLVLENPKLLT